MAGATSHPEQDDAPMALRGLTRRGRLCPTAQQAGHAQPRDARQADPEHVAPAEQYQAFAVAGIEIGEGVLVGVSVPVRLTHGGPLLTLTDPPSCNLPA